MSRFSKTFVAVAVAAVSAVASAAPAFAAPAGWEGPTAPLTGSGPVLQPLTPAELARVRSRSPEKYDRMLKTVAASAPSSEPGTAGPRLYGTGLYRVHNWNSDKCLAIGSSSTANGANAIQWDCLAASLGQLWYIDSDRHIINYNSDKYLAIGSSSTANGAKAIQWDFTNSNGQRWAWKEKN